MNGVTPDLKDAVVQDKVNFLLTRLSTWKVKEVAIHQNSITLGSPLIGDEGGGSSLLALPFTSAICEKCFH